MGKRELRFQGNHYESPKVLLFTLSAEDVIRTSGDTVRDDWNKPASTEVFRDEVDF